MITSTPLRIVGLCRMSVAYDDYGNDRQEKAIRDMCARRGAVIVAVKRDVMSATKYRINDRPGYIEGQRMITDGLADAIGIYHLDRLTRDNRDLEVVIDSGTQIMCAAGEIDLSTDMGRTVARILTAVAKGEVERKAARQKLELSQRLDRGMPFPGGPRLFGYSADGMDINESETEALRWAVQECLTGKSLRYIARGLSTAGFASSRAKHSTARYGWTHAGIKQMLINPRYAGYRVADGKEWQGIWPTLLDLETHMELKRLLGDPRRDPMQGRPRSRHNPTNLLSLTARCDVCGDLLIAGRGGDSPHYRCRSTRSCCQPPRQELNTAVTEEVLALLSQPSFVETLIPASDERAGQSRSQIDKLHRRLQVLNDGFADGDYDDNPEEYQRTLRDLNAKITLQRAVLDDVADMAMFTSLAVGTDQIVEQWRELSVERQRTIIGRLLDVRVRPSGNRRAWNVDEHLTVTRRRPILAG